LFGHNINKLPDLKLKNILFSPTYF